MRNQKAANKATSWLATKFTCTGEIKRKKTFTLLACVRMASTFFRFPHQGGVFVWGSERLKREPVPSSTGIRSEEPNTGVPHFIAFHRCCIFFFLLTEGKTPHQLKDYASLYCHTHFVMVVWSRTCHISELYL